MKIMGIDILTVVDASRTTQAGHVQNLHQTKKRKRLEMTPKEDGLITRLGHVLITKRRYSRSPMKSIDS